ncbi:MAG TPA: LysM peptidoglycan-binding domain-containing protein [Atribacterota bacterium]|nr:LysM peptidoglycan-binding domain-containing protein [Atribacterota bacterium]
MNYVKNNSIACIIKTSVFSLLIVSFLTIITANVSGQQYVEYQIKEGDCLWTISRQFQLSIQELTELNDIDKEKVLSPGLLIKIPQNQSSDSSEKQEIPTTVHTVQKGESLWDIAQKYRLSLDRISSVNNLKKPDSLYIGQEINIPIEKKETEQDEISELSFEPEKASFQGMSTSLNQEFRESVKETDYAVKPGESLWSIAQNYQVSLRELSQLNGLENEERLSVGQIIKIPLPERAKNDTNKREDNEEEYKYDWVEHIVEPGENISIIAQKYYVPVEKICQLNQISEQDYVYPGQRIKIKASEQVAGGSKTAQDVISKDEKSEKNNISSEEDSQPVYYTVKPGDTLWSIAQNYDVSMEGILAVNYLSNKDVLSVGQKLEIPAMGGSNQGSQKIQIVEYTVVKGDSLWNIAQKFDIKMHEIISINQLDNITQLSVGQKLDIPASERAVASGQEKKASATSTGKQEEKPKDVIHTVQKGETLWGISRKYQVSIQSITSSNRISESSRLVVGQKLTIPNVRNSSIPTRSFIWPLNGLITSQFGMRTLGGRRDYHTGIDIDGRTGDSIRVVESGKVSFSGYINGYGNIIIVEHAGGYSTVYAHNSNNLVREGQRVSKGDIIARVGATGNSTGSHLHFEIREDGKPVNPLIYLP